MQAAQTRAAVLQAAQQLFADNGWVGTSMPLIARTADVSVETIYSTIGSKAAVLTLVVDVAVAGDDEPVPLADRPEYADAALRQGAAAEAGLAELLATIDRNRREQTIAGGQLIAGRPLHDTEIEIDEVWMLTRIAVYDLLVRDSGWSREQYGSGSPTASRNC